ncbi:bifunctional 3-(3-hydroxy-phenyl)propionate/3-hydroxycinnamic acid hydroxylase [Burkholderia sp. Bp9143]|uniref:bifunctional 3-(3-hydroxy-phenyl)propionate/3-hydroxycinnamic acid hydroxylase n=1 Tax=Burkholderia sp. Bp9143 TaxID=2184574 RepID=UPI000F5ACF7F|nr:bifunctional 3-(3-hydroxy-phenyl)propionate/3-hydroxycinnamic acid hydroxylase [Burkholderia sp. Bp9143]RQR34384.1 bifunctional 3-(3-hydroxy-phenyl)propionate/3-hydroxycinnamic acid hydroxylase [Burkholderia sp. Bp9143]
METFEATGAHSRAAGEAPSADGRGLPSATDILIVGFGPVGAALANLLARHGVKVMVIDKATDIFMAPRAIALDNDALRILQMAGVDEHDFETVAIPYVRMRSPALGEFGRIDTLGTLDGHPKLVTFYQPDLERCLRERLRGCDNVHVALGMTFEGFVEEQDGVVASLTDESGHTHAVRARYLVGADGASSRVRQLIGQQFNGKTYAEDWLIVDARHVPRPIDHVEFICDHRRPTPHMVAPGARERWEFMLHPGERRDEMESDARIRELLAPWGNVDDITIERKAVYRFHARTVDTFSKGRVFLAGDAAHITPPFVGQGLVAGLRDAANLGWKLAWVVLGRADPRILETYDAERRPHARAMIRLAKLMGRLVMPRNAAVALATHGLMRMLRCVPVLRTQFEELRIKPQNAFRMGLFVRGRSGARLTRGAALSQGWLRGSDGTVRLSDDVLGSGCTLVGFGCDPRVGLAADAAAALACAGGTIVQIAHRGQRLDAGGREGWEDLDGTFLPGMAPVGWVAVVRPDKTVVHDGPAADVSRIVRDSLLLLGVAPRAMPSPAASVVRPS